MRAVVQKVNKASVTVDEESIGSIDKGLLVLLGIGKDDDECDVEYMVKKIIGLRIFEDDNDKMNLSVKDVQGEILVVSQFTLYGDTRKGKRPNFMASASPDMAEKYYNDFIDKCLNNGIKTETGLFGAHMKIELINDGPVTIMIDSKKVF